MLLEGMLKRSIITFAVFASVYLAASTPVQGYNSDVPAYHSKAPVGKLAPALPPAQFKEADTRAAYKAASGLKSTLYQVPCYCHCDRFYGHKSLLSCFQPSHGSECEVCKKELYFVSQEVNKGKSISDIGDEVIRGEWRSVSLKQLAEWKP